MSRNAALLALVFALLGVFIGQLFNNPQLDGAASIAIGLLMMSVAGILAPRTRGLLLGEGVNPDELADIRRRVESGPSVERAVDILTMYIGPHDLLVNTGVQFAAGTRAEQMHEAIHSIGANLRIAYQETNRGYNEAESPPTGKRSVIGTALRRTATCHQCNGEYAGRCRRQTRQP